MIFSGRQSTFSYVLIEENKHPGACFALRFAGIRHPDVTIDCLVFSTNNLSKFVMSLGAILVLGIPIDPFFVPELSVELRKDENRVRVSESRPPTTRCRQVATCKRVPVSYI